MKIGNDERSGSGGRTNWPVVLAGCVGAAAGIVLSGLAISLSGLEGFWPGVIGAGVGAGLGVFLGQIVGARVFRRPRG